MRQLLSILLCLVLLSSFSCSSSSSPDITPPDDGTTDDEGGDDNNSGGTWKLTFEDEDWDGKTFLYPARIHESSDGYYAFGCATYQKSESKQDIASGTGHIYRVDTDGQSSDRQDLTDILPYDVWPMGERYVFLVGSRIVSQQEQAVAAIVGEDGSIPDEVSWPGIDAIERIWKTSDNYLLATVYDDQLHLIMLNQELETDWEQQLTDILDPNLPDGMHIRVTRLADLIQNTDGSFSAFVQTFRVDGDEEAYGMGLVQVSQTGELLWSRCWWDNETPPIQEPQYSPGRIVNLSDGGYLINYVNNNAGTFYVTTAQLDHAGDTIWSWTTSDEGMSPQGLLRQDEETISLIRYYELGERHFTLYRLSADGELVTSISHAVGGQDFPTDVITTTDDHLLITGGYQALGAGSNGFFLLKLNAEGECPDCD